MILYQIHQPSHLKTLCLVSKTVSSIATQFLYRNLVLDNLNEECAQKEMLDVVKADGLRFVKTLKVGPITGKMVTLFDHLIFKLQDHSLTNFEWDEYGPPFNPQLVYVWDHQRTSNLLILMIGFCRMQLELFAHGKDPNFLRNTSICL